MIFRYSVNRQMRMSIPLLLLSLLLVGFSGCKTVPELSVKDYPALVSENGSLFVSFNIRKDRDLVVSYLEKNEKGNDLSRIIDRTDRISFSFADQVGHGYSAVAEGNYPSLITTFALTNSKEWVKHKGIYTWWENKDAHLQLALPINSIALFSTDNIIGLMEKFKNGERGYIPDSVRREMEKSAVLVYTSSPSPSLFSAFGLKIDPDDVVKLDISLIRNNSESSSPLPVSYKIWGYIQLRDTVKARAFNTGLKLGLLTMAIREGNTAIRKLIKENPFVLRDTRIIFNGVNITLSDILDVMKDKK